MHLKEKLHSLPGHHAVLAERSPNVLLPMGRHRHQLRAQRTTGARGRQSDLGEGRQGHGDSGRRFETRGGTAIVQRSREGDGTPRHRCRQCGGLSLKTADRKHRGGLRLYFRHQYERRFFHVAGGRPPRARRRSHCRRFDRRHEDAFRQHVALSRQQRGHRAVCPLAVA